AAFGFSVLICFYLLGGMGAGDVKLLTAVGAWLGLSLTLAVFLAASLAAGVYVVAVTLFYHTQGDLWANLQIAWLRIKLLGRHLASEQRIEAEVARPDCRGRIIPFAAMIAVGLALILLLVWLGPGA